MNQYRFLRFPEGKQKAVTISYDDGVRSDLRLAEIFDQYGMKATFNLSCSVLDEKNAGYHMTAKEIEEHILAKGHEVAVHGEHHLAPGKLRPVDGIREFLNCRLRLEKAFDRIIRGMAYPNSGIRQMDPGNGYAKVREYLADLDFAYARTLDGDNDNFRLPEDWLAWMPTAHHENPLVFEYIKKFNAIKNDTSVYCDARSPRLFYLWGHSFEFDRNRNWDRIEEICKTLGRREDTFYATNIEIHDYVTAYLSLRFSADGSIVHNPTDTKVWFEIIDDRMYTVEPGQTIKINEA